MLIFEKFAEIQSWLTLRRVDSEQANTAQSQIPRQHNFCLCRPLQALIGKMGK